MTLENGGIPLEGNELSGDLDAPGSVRLVLAGEYRSEEGKYKQCCGREGDVSGILCGEVECMGSLISGGGRVASLPEVSLEVGSVSILSLGQSHIACPVSPQVAHTIGASSIRLKAPDPRTMSVVSGKPR